jgi:hypothetical protein
LHVWMLACLLAWLIDWLIDCLLAWTRKRTTFSCGRFEAWPRRIRQLGRIQHGENQWCPPYSSRARYHHSNTLRQPRHSHPRIAVFGQRAYAGAVRKSNLVCELIISTLSSLIHDPSLSLSISLKLSEWPILQILLLLLNADITNKDCARSWHKSCSDYIFC